MTLALLLSILATGTATSQGPSRPRPPGQPIASERIPEGVFNKGPGSLVFDVVDHNGRGRQSSELSVFAVAVGQPTMRDGEVDEIPLLPLGSATVDARNGQISVDVEALTSHARGRHRELAADLGAEGLEFRLFVGDDKSSGVVGFDSSAVESMGVDTELPPAAIDADQSESTLVLTPRAEVARRLGVSGWSAEHWSICGSQPGGSWIPAALVKNGVEKYGIVTELAYVKTAPTVTSQVRLWDNLQTTVQVGAVVNFSVVEFSVMRRTNEGYSVGQWTNIGRNQYKALSTNLEEGQYQLRCIDTNFGGGTLLLPATVYNEWLPESMTSLNPTEPVHPWIFDCPSNFTNPLTGGIELEKSSMVEYPDAATFTVSTGFGNLSLGLDSRQAYQKTTRFTITYEKKFRGAASVCGNNNPAGNPSVGKIRTQGQCMVNGEPVPPSQCVPLA